MPSTPSLIEPSALMHSDIIISAHSLHGLYICTDPTISFTMPPNHRPQTLKQAKKAYRKSGATVHLSESELAIIERRIVLQERADRMKEREARRKANIKRKEERNQRERETRARMGIKEPVKEGIAHVGPSQLSLGGFLGPGEKRKREGEEEEGYDGSRVTIGPTRAESGFRKEQGGVECHNTPTQRTPWRNPLKVIPANLIARKIPSEDSAKADTLVAKVAGLTRMASPSSSQNCFQPRSPLSHAQQRIPPATAQRLGFKIPKEVSDKHEDYQVMVMAPPPSRIPPQGPPRKPCPQPKPLRQPNGADITTQGSVKMESCQYTSMAPPPRRAIAQCRPCDTKIPQKPSVTAPSINLPGTNEECWDDFFVSGTQIARELSPPAVKAISDGPPGACLQSHASALHPTGSKSETAYPKSRPKSNLPLPARPPSQTRKVPLMTPKDDTAGLLNLISTQDLDFSGILTQAPPHIVRDDTDDLLAQISSQDLDFSGELTQAAPQAPSTVSSDFNEDLTEEDLEDVALEFERESTMAKSRTTTPHSQRTKPETAEEARDREPQHIQFSTKNSKPSSSANIAAIHNSNNESGSGTHAPNQAVEGYHDLPQPQQHPPNHSHDHQLLHPPSDSDDDWGNVDEYTFDNDIIPDKNPKQDVEKQPEQADSDKKIKTEKNIIFHVPRTCSQEAKLAAEYDIFELSTQDLRELEA